MSTQQIKGIEIFAVGRWNAATFNSEDIDSIVESFNALGFSGKVPLKLGHEGPDGRLVTGDRDKKGRLKNPLDQLAMGWVDRIYREGNRILADIDVPDRVAELIQDKQLKFVSVELLREVRTSRRVFPWVLDAVALLGTDPPAVGVLKDIQTIEMAQRTEDYQFERVASFARADYQPITIGVEKEMTEKITLEELSEKLVQLGVQVSTLSGENRDLKQQLAGASQTKTEFKALQAQVAQEKVVSHRKAIKGHMEQAVKDERILPEARERFMKAFKIDSDDEILMELTIEDDVEQYIKQNPNPKRKDKKKIFQSLAKPTDELPEGVEPDAGAVMLMEAQLRQDGKHTPTDRDIEAAVIKTFKANPEAAQAYQAQQNEIQFGGRR